MTKSTSCMKFQLVNLYRLKIRIIYKNLTIVQQLTDDASIKLDMETIGNVFPLI